VLSLSAHAWIDDRHVDARRHVWDGVRQHKSAPAKTCCGGIPCVMSITSTSGAIRLITPRAGAGEVVLEAEIGQEGDELTCDAASLTAATRPSRSWVRASATTSSPAARASPEVTGRC
jgi:hypothetical protein